MFILKKTHDIEIKALKAQIVRLIEELEDKAKPVALLRRFRFVFKNRKGPMYECEGHYLETKNDYVQVIKIDKNEEIVVYRTYKKPVEIISERVSDYKIVDDEDFDIN